MSTVAIVVYLGRSQVYHTERLPLQYVCRDAAHCIDSLVTDNTGFSTKLRDWLGRASPK